MNYDMDSYGMCFCCGKDNPIGLHLEFSFEGDEYVTYYTPKPEHQSYPGITHGGLISAVLDEVMGRRINEIGLAAVTARMEVRLRHSVPIGDKVRFVSQIVHHKGKLIEMMATGHLPDGRLAAEATARFVVVDQMAKATE